MRHVLLAPSRYFVPTPRCTSSFSFASSLVSFASSLGLTAKPRFTPSHLLLALSILAAAGTSARAQDYPWCANYTKGSTSCSFVTYEQCMTDVSGIGGFCERNSQYHPAAAPARPKPHASSKLN